MVLFGAAPGAFLQAVLVRPTDREAGGRVAATSLRIGLNRFERLIDAARKNQGSARFTCGQPLSPAGFRLRANSGRETSNIAAVFVRVDSDWLSFLQPESSLSLSLQTCPRDRAQVAALPDAIPAALIGRLARDQRARAGRCGAPPGSTRFVASWEPRAIAVFAIVVDAKDERQSRY